MSQAPDSTQVNIASLYVGDLKPDVNETILWSIFSPYGQVLSIKVCRDSQTRASLGYAYVNYRTAQEAEKAMESVNFASIEGKTCRVMWSMRDPNRRKLGIGNVIIKNIDTLLDSKSLCVAFLTYGPILSCKIAVNEYGLGKGYGFIQFYNESDAENACNKTNGVVFMKKKLIVTKFIPKNERKDAKNVNPDEFTNVFVKNFNENYDEISLKKLFSKFGDITSCVVQKDPIGKSLGHGFVNFEKPECAAAAVVSMNDFVLQNGDKLFASKAMKKLERQAFLKKEYEKRKQEYYKQFQNLNLYVKNFDESVNDEKLNSLFSPYGKIKSAVVKKDESGKSKGFGFVCFTTCDEAAAAIEGLNSKIIDTKPLYVSFAQNKDERKKVIDLEGYNNSYRPNMFPSASMPFIYPHPATVPYSHPPAINRYNHNQPRPMQPRPMQPVGGPGGQGYQQQNFRHNYNFNQNYNQGGNYAQQNFRPRATHAMNRNPNPLGYSQRPRPAHVSVNHVVSENVSRPKHYEPKVSQKAPVQDTRAVFKDRIYRICQSVLLEKSFNMDCLPQVSGVVIDYFTDAHSSRGIDDKEIVDAVVNAYIDYINSGADKTQ